MRFDPVRDLLTIRLSIHMRLWHTKTVWEKLARHDPYWAVLTDPAKKGNRWDLAEFFATGRKTVVLDIAAISAVVPELPRGRVLDFGCGVGRLSQGLAAHFEQVDGVDIAEPMIELAREHNQFKERVTYHLNPKGDLSLFPDDHFQLIYSVISLQHIPSVLIPGYLEEFARVCRPGGLIFFQLPSQAQPTQFRFSWYPPTLWMRVKRYILTKTTIRAEMTMNSLKKERVLAILAQNNVKSLQIAPYHAAGDLESFSYLFQKGSCR